MILISERAMRLAWGAMRMPLLAAVVLLVLSIPAHAVPTPTPTAVATPAAPIYPSGKITYLTLPPFIQVATATTGSAGAALTLGIPAGVQYGNMTTVLYGGSLSCTNPASTVDTTLTVSGVQGQSPVYQVVESSTTGTYLPIDLMLPAASTSSIITFTLGAAASGGTCTINVSYGFED
jgi:hypothetical protein